MNHNSFTHIFAKGLHLFFIAALAAGLALDVTPARVAYAVNFTVNSTADAVDANPGDSVCATAGGACTLRAAIQEANALSGDDTITLPAGTYTLTIAGAGEDAAATGDLDITSNLTINGADMASTIIQAGVTIATSVDRVFHITSAGLTVAINNVTIQNGNAFEGDGGGGIRNFGTLTLTNSSISSNSGDGGGGIRNFGTLIITGSSFSGNSTMQAGGGIENFNGTVNVTNSTFSGNSAGIVGVGGGISNFQGSVTLDSSIVSNNTAQAGGGIRNNGGTLTIMNSTLSNNSAEFSGGILSGEFGGILTLINSTLSGNSATVDGGGITNFEGTVNVTNTTLSDNSAGNNGGGILNTRGFGSVGTVNLNSVTITNNTADSDSDGGGDGGGIFNESSNTVNFRNTLIAGNTDSGGQAPDCSGTLNSQGYNLIQNATSCAITSDPTGNLTGVDPLLGPLQDNGGPTFTHALSPGSPAIDAGNPAPPGSGGNACEATDQRGVVRPQGARCDIGAFESDILATPTPTYTPTNTPSNTPNVTPTRTHRPTRTPTPTLTRTRPLPRTRTPMVTRPPRPTRTPTP